jgi:hypothetical protein
VKSAAAIAIGAAASTFSFLVGYVMRPDEPHTSIERVYLVLTDADEALPDEDAILSMSDKEADLVFNGPPVLSEALLRCDAGELFFSETVGVHRRPQVAVDWLNILDARKSCVETLMESEKVHWRFVEAASPIELGLSR